MANALIYSPFQKTTEPEFIDLTMLSEYDPTLKTTDTKSTTTGANTTTTVGSMVLGNSVKDSILSITYESLGGVSFGLQVNS